MIAIVELSGENAAFENQVYKLNDKILYRLKNLEDYYIIQTSQKENYQQFEYVKDIREEQIGSVQTLHFTPKITSHNLRHNYYVGWGGVTVAVIDSGINGIPVVFSMNILDNSNNVQDYINHGTIVANIVKYFADACNIAAFKVTDDGSVFESKVIMALDYIASNPQRFNIVNLSIAFSKKCNASTCVTCKLIGLLEGLGILVIAAAGNYGSALDTIRCPGCSKSALTVGALSQDGKGVADFSGRGDGKSDKPDLIAPSHVCIQLVQKKIPDVVSGTSIAAPVITGICASFFDKTNKNYKIVKNVIMRSLTKLDDCPECAQGAGTIDMDKLMEVLEDEFNHSGIKQPSHEKIT